MYTNEINTLVERFKEFYSRFDKRILKANSSITVYAVKVGIQVRWDAYGKHFSQVYSN